VRRTGVAGGNTIESTVAFTAAIGLLLSCRIVYLNYHMNSVIQLNGCAAERSIWRQDWTGLD